MGFPGRKILLSSRFINTQVMVMVISKVKPFCFALIAENLVGLIVKVGKEHFIKNISLVTAV